jgi:hypothetical protein
MTSLLIRSVLFIFWAAVAAQVALVEAQSAILQQPFSEFGYVESLQAIILAASAMLLFWMARFRQHQAQLALCAGLAFSILFIRELDQVLELFLPHGIWKWIALLLASVLAWWFLRHRQAIKGQLLSLSRTPAFGVYLAAGATLVFARLFGRRRFWEAVMDERFFRQVKNAAEESIELFALGLFFAATLEWVFSTRRDDKQ